MNLTDPDALRLFYPPMSWWSKWLLMWGCVGAQVLHRWPREVWGL